MRGEEFGDHKDRKKRTKLSKQASANILVVDDDAETLELLREILGEEGYRVVTSSSGEEALEVGKQELFDVIISDMRLGTSLNGLDVLRTYKTIQPESEVILITAFGSMETAIEAVKAGAFDYISKPFKIDEVLLQVEPRPGQSEADPRKPQPEAAA